MQLCSQPCSIKTHSSNSKTKNVPKASIKFSSIDLEKFALFYILFNSRFDESRSKFIYYHEDTLAEDYWYKIKG